MAELTFVCGCGQVVWSLDEATPPTGIRYVCHCDDCQAFAHFTGQADLLLDGNGGTEAYQLPASRLRVLRGLDHLACVQMTARPLLRWHCGACLAPVANTYGAAQLSFVSVPLACASANDRDAVLAQSAGHVWTKFGHGDLSGVTQVSIPAMLWRMASRIVAARISGDYRNNPFFRPDTGEPIVAPRRLLEAERSELDCKARAGAPT